MHWEWTGQRVGGGINLVVHWEWTGPMLSTGRELLSAQFGSVSAATSLDLQPVFLCHPWERGYSVVSLAAFGASAVDFSHVSCTACIPLLHLVGLVSWVLLIKCRFHLLWSPLRSELVSGRIRYLQQCFHKLQKPSEQPILIFLVVNWMYIIGYSKFLDISYFTGGSLN